MFLVSFALSLPVYAKMGDIFGRVGIFIFAAVIFILGSGLYGASKSMNMLIRPRVVQGLGGGGIYGLVNVSRGLCFGETSNIGEVVDIV